MTPACAERLRLGEYRGHQHGTRVTSQCNVVEIERVGRGGVDPRGFRRRGGIFPEHERGLSRWRLERRNQQLHHRFPRAGDHHAHAIRKTGADH